MRSVPGTLTRTIRALKEMLSSWATPARGTETAAHTRALIEPLVTLVTERDTMILAQAEKIGHLKAELEALSAEVVRAKARERHLVGELERHRAEHRPDSPRKAHARPSAAWTVR